MCAMKDPFPYIYTTNQMKWEKFKNKILQTIHEQVLQHNRESWAWWFHAFNSMPMERIQMFQIYTHHAGNTQKNNSSQVILGGLKIFSIVFEQWNSSLMKQNYTFKTVLNCVPIIPVFKRSKHCPWVQGHPGIDSEFQAKQTYRVRPCLKQTRTANNDSTRQTVYDLMLQQKDRTQTGVLAPISTANIITLWKDEYVQITIFMWQKWKTIPRVLLFGILPLIVLQGSASI